MDGRDFEDAIHYTSLGPFYDLKKENLDELSRMYAIYETNQILGGLLLGIRDFSMLHIYADEVFNMLSTGNFEPNIQLFQYYVWYIFNDEDIRKNVIYTLKADIGNSLKESLIMYMVKYRDCYAEDHIKFLNMKGIKTITLEDIDIILNEIKGGDRVSREESSINIY